MKRIVLVLVLVMFLTTLSAQGQRMTLGTQSAGTLFYTVGGGIAKLLQTKLSRQVTVQPAAGASVYVPLVESGEITMGISSSLDSGSAYRGDHGRKPTKGLRSVARLWPLSYAYVATARSGMKSVSDLKGKRVVVDIQANATLGAANAAMLATAGLRSTDVRAVTVGDIPQGLRGVGEGTLDAAPFAVGGPLVKEIHASTPGGIVYLALDGRNANNAFLASQARGLYVLNIQPSDALAELKQPINVLGYDIFLVVGSRVPDTDVTAILKTLHENWSSLQKDYPALRPTKPSDLAGSTNAVPYHPAAIAYFKAQKLWSPENDKNEAALK